VKEIRDAQLLIKLGERIKTLRQERSMTLEQLAYASELELSQVHRVERAKRNASIRTLHALAKGLEITLAELFDGVE